eukprot:2819961-Pyramimonas_sp.AAC.1
MCKCEHGEPHHVCAVADSAQGCRRDTNAGGAPRLARLTRAALVRLGRRASRRSGGCARRTTTASRARAGRPS